MSSVLLSLERLVLIALEHWRHDWSITHTVSGKVLSCLPLQLILRGKSTTQSYRILNSYVDLTLRDAVNIQKPFKWQTILINNSKHLGLINML